MNAGTAVTTSSLRRGWTLTKRLMAINVRARMEYRADFVLGFVLGIVFQVAALAFVFVVVGSFGGIGGWSLQEVLFIAGIRLTAHALVEMVFGNLTIVTWMIRDGWMDRVLVRPANTLLQVVLFQFRANGMGDLVVGGLALASGIRGIDATWNAWSGLLLVLVIAGSMLLEAGLLLAIAALGFWVVRTESLMWWADDLTNTFGNYPLTVFPAMTRFLLTFVVPIGFLGFYPATMFLGRTGDVPFTPLLAYGAPLVGIAVFVGAYGLWVRGIAHHRSTGT
jgi:ABC-2 type transport system permease protein